jgi:hypothetical protein
MTFRILYLKVTTFGCTYTGTTTLTALWFWGADEAKSWLRRSYEAYKHALHAFALPRAPDGDIREPEAEEQKRADQMLLRSFQLYQLVHPVPAAADTIGWGASQVVSFCQKTFKAPKVPIPPPNPIKRVVEEGKDSICLSACKLTPSRA